MTWKSYAAVSGGTLLVTYLFSAPPTIAPGRPPAARTAAVAAGSAPSSADIQQQAARLESRGRVETEYRPPARNPFRFGGRPAAPKPAVRAPEPLSDAPAVVPSIAAPPPPPPIRLAGIVTNTVDGVRQRTAVFNTPEGVVTAREGEAAGAYRVTHVDEDAVEVVGPDGIPRRISLRP
jgi:hypothetical protein